MQSANRLRDRRDYFILRQDRYPFHIHQDGPALARLDPDAGVTQMWTLYLGHEVEVRPGDVQWISKQVLGIELPPCRALAGSPPVATREPIKPILETAIEDEPVDFAKLATTLVSAALKDQMMQGETPVAAKARLTPLLMLEHDRLHQLVLGDRDAVDGSDRARQKEISALLSELALIGDKGGSSSA
jgi:hypothetical protein